MVDINLVRENPDRFKEILKNRQKEESLVDKLLEADSKRRELIQRVEELRADKNKFAKERNVEEGKKVKTELQSLEPELSKSEEDYQNYLSKIPNEYSEDTPVGKNEDENTIIRSWGEPTKFDFEPKDHVELGQALGIIEIEKASKISGARFAYLIGDLARLEFALVQLVFDTLTNAEKVKEIADSIESGYNAKTFIPVVPPVMMKPEVMERMARIEPKEERYYIPQSDLYLVGSAEHTLGPLHMDETLSEKEFPIRYVGFSTSFREEAGSYGKDTRGILRVHQFDKVEMESFTVPENSIKEQNFFVAIQEHLMQSLGIPYQVMAICTGDLGGPDYRQIDINSWMPGQNKYRETHTSDLMTDYQSRRLNTRVQRKGGVEYVHMNDATAFAIGRTLITILENYQEADGSVIIPEVLRKWMGKDKIEINK